MLFYKFKYLIFFLSRYIHNIYKYLEVHNNVKKIKLEYTIFHQISCAYVYMSIFILY